MKDESWIRRQLKKIKINVQVLFLAITDTKTRWYVKAWGYIVFTYALSPIDLIPDFIPILGYLDDLILIPFGIWIFIILLGEKKWHAYVLMIEDKQVDLKKHWYYALAVIFLWIMILSVILYFVFR